jgi:uncharacterized protein YutE (UPF0331/DUF86 family)
MTPSTIRRKVVLERVAWIRKMLDEIRLLPLETFDEFNSDSRNPNSAESCLRRALEALLDLGRHILAKRFGRGVVQYKEIAEALAENHVIDSGAAEILVELAGYRNRMVYFYNEVTREELFDICTTQLADVERVLDSILDWLRENPDALDQSI